MFKNICYRLFKIPYILHVHEDRKSDAYKATLVLLHGLGESSRAWDKIAQELPDDLRVISIDLLGFGKSPKPEKTKYNISIQAKSVARTLLKYGVKQRVIVIGHSMGGLTAIELAKKYPVFVRGLVLCGPPIYNESQRKAILPENGKILKNFYRYAIKNPELMTSLAPVAAKLKITGEAFELTQENVAVYMAALESSILHQTSYEDIKKIRKPTTIIYGVVDPLVIKKNYKRIQNTNSHVKLVRVAAGHELAKAYVKPVQNAVDAIRNVD